MTRAASLTLALITLAVMIWTTLPETAGAASREEIDVRIAKTLQKFREEVPGANDVLRKAKGIIVMPKVYKAGIGIGGQYGEGALRVAGRNIDYYSLASASYGFQLGAQKKSIILAFMDQSALQSFRNSKGWEVGADASVVLVKVGAEENISSDTYNKPILGFVVGQKGLMYDLSLEGTKFTRIKK